MTLSIIDTGSIHYRARHLRKAVDYAKLFRRLPVGEKLAFGTDFNQSAAPFIHRLQCLGYKAQFKPVILIDGKPITTTCDVEIAIKAMQTAGPIVLVTSNYMLIPLAMILKSRVSIIGFEATRVFPAGLDVSDLTDEDII